MKIKPKFIFFVLLFLILVKPVWVVFQNRQYLFSPGYEKQYNTYKMLYDSSQYMQKKNPVIIQDQIFRSFAGGAFLKGLNPILIVHDHPPLGNYMIAASIFFFDNPRTLMVPIFFFILLGIYLLSKKAIQNSLLALIPLAIFANEPILLNKLTHAPLIEPIQLPFILFAFYFYIKAMQEKKYMKWFILTSLFLGIVISARFFVTGGVMVSCMLLFLFYKSKQKLNRKFFSFVVTLPLALVILVLSYTKTILDGSSILHIFGIQKYILEYHKSKFVLPFSFWDLLLFNRWHTWWGSWGISSDPQWLLIWPISFVVTCIHFFFMTIKKIKLNDTEKIIFLWLALYSVTLSSGFSSTNYFLPILPFLYILATSFVVKISFAFARAKRKRLLKKLKFFPAVLYWDRLISSF